MITLIWPLGLWWLYCTFEKFLVVFLWQIAQVLWLWMLIPVLIFLAHGSIFLLQLMLNLLRSFWSCQNVEGISQVCQKIFWTCFLSCNIWSICSVTVLCQCTIHIIHWNHMLLSFKVFHGPGLLLLLVQMVCNWSWIFQRFVHYRIDLDWLCIFKSDSECFFLDTRVYPKVVMSNLDWHCTILQ